jgi:hypothetical protein
MMSMIKLKIITNFKKRSTSNQHVASAINDQNEILAASTSNDSLMSKLDKDTYNILTKFDLKSNNGEIFIRLNEDTKVFHAC